MIHAIILLLVGAGFAFAADDVAVLSDGDRFTGTIQKMEKGNLFFKSKYSETALEIDWKLVSGLTTSQEFQVTMQDGTEQSGKLAMSSSGAVSLESSGSSKALDIASSVVAFAPKASPEKEAGWVGRAWQNTSLSLDLGQSYSGSARYNQVSSNSELEYKGDRWDANLVTHLDYYGGTDSSRSTYQGYGRFAAQRYIGGDHFYLFPYMFLGRQTNSEGGKGQIRQYGGGAGWTFGRQTANQVSLFAGVVRSFTTGFAITDETRVNLHLDTPLFTSGVLWEKTFKNKIETSLKLYYFKPLLEPGHHAMAVDASAKIPLFGPAYFKVSAYDTPELKQRQLFSTKNLQISSGIGIEF